VSRRPHLGESAPPVVLLMGGHAGEADEAGLTDVGAGQKSGEFRKRWW
jgi:hypothetical protein